MEWSSDSDSPGPDYAFGQRLLTLRAAIGLTQARLAAYLGVSRRAVVKWEGGNRYPTAEHLKKYIEFAVQQGAFPAGRESVEIRALWRASRQRVLLDEGWLAALLGQAQESPARPRSSATPQVAPLDQAPVPLGDPPLREPDTARRPPPEPPVGGARLDWGSAPSVSTFYGRTGELDLLTRWTVEEGCRVVGVLGLGGIGKSALAIHLMHHVAGHFDVVIWRSLRDAPTIDALLDDCLQGVAPQVLAAGDTGDPHSTAGRLNALLEFMRHTRILLVLDNLETLLAEGVGTGQMREGYAAFSRLLRLVAETAHRSCLFFTSREKPTDLGLLEGTHAPVRTLRITRLDADACAALLAEKAVQGTGAQRASLIDAYAGNPLALKIVAQTIVDLFGGEPGPFLEQGRMIFGGVRGLLAEQFNRLSPFEQRVMVWLAILREPASLVELRALLVTPVPAAQLLEGVEALHRRSLIERGQQAGSFTLQSVVLEYVTARLISEAGAEIAAGRLERLREHGLVLAQAPQYVRQTQERLIVAPILEQLRAAGDASGVEQLLLQLLASWRGRPAVEQGYGPSNVISLLRLLRGDLRALDLSRLAIRQAYLAELDAQDASLVHARLVDAVLGEPFDFPTSIALSADGAFLLAGTPTGEVRLWQVAGRMPILAVHGHSSPVFGLGVSADGALIASGSYDGTVKLWEAPSGRLLATLAGHTGGVWAVALSANGALIASGGADRTVKLWEAPSGRLLATLAGHTGGRLTVALSRDGRLLASGSVDGTVRLWETPRGRPLGTLRGHDGGVWPVALSGDGTLLASGGVDGTVKLWEVHSGRVLATLDCHNGGARNLALSRDGKLVAIGGYDGTVRLWEATSGRVLAALRAHNGAVQNVALSGDGRLLASGGADGAVRLWETPRGRPLATLQGPNAGVQSVALRADGGLLASGSYDGTVRLWEVQSGRLLATLQGHESIVAGLALSGDGRLLASGGVDRTLKLWEASSGRLLAALEGHTGGILAVALSRDGTLLASGGVDGTARLWEAPNGRPLAILQGHAGGVLALALSMDGGLLASGDYNGTVRLWEMPGGRPLATLDGHTGGGVQGLAFSGDGRLLVSGGHDGTVKLWEVVSGTVLATLQAHAGGAYSVALSRDGRLLASGGSDGAVRLWEVPSGRPLATLHGHTRGVYGLALSGDGGLLASGSIDGTVRLWETQSSTHLRTLRPERRYERMDITGLTGVTEAQRTALIALGAVERGE